ncbi:MAG: hypothetical protein HY901_31205 [Deltaproteobacteria bacterium]|nr:hypothetical protein [Deltaproteobacteria bacterium]
MRALKVLILSGLFLVLSAEACPQDCLHAGTVYYELVSVRVEQPCVVEVAANLKWVPCNGDPSQETRYYSLDMASGATRLLSSARGTGELATASVDGVQLDCAQSGKRALLTMAAQKIIGTDPLRIGELRDAGSSDALGDITIDARQ